MLNTLYLKKPKIPNTNSSFSNYCQSENGTTSTQKQYYIYSTKSIVMELIKIIKRKIERREKQVKELEVKIDSGQSPARIKQEYIEVKAELSLS